MLKAITKRVAAKLPGIKDYFQKIERLRGSFCRDHPPGHYYSPLPDFEEVHKRLADIWPRNRPKEIPGVDLNENGQLELLNEVRPYYSENPFSAQKKSGLRYYFANDYFSFSDGIFYYCMLRHIRPRRVVEIGSGFSSAVLLDTNDLFFASEIRCTFIDPEPDRLFSLIGLKHPGTVRVIPEKMQDVSMGVFETLGRGDILFVDSSHVSKIGSDVNRIFFEIFPMLPPGVHIHVHDVFYPFEYPPGYIRRKWAWNEQYLLRMFLAYNPRFRITIFPSFLERYHGDALAAALPLAWQHPPGWPSLRGASIWLERIS